MKMVLWYYEHDKLN